MRFRSTIFRDYSFLLNYKKQLSRVWVSVTEEVGEGSIRSASELLREERNFERRKKEKIQKDIKHWRNSSNYLSLYLPTSPFS